MPDRLVSVVREQLWADDGCLEMTQCGGHLVICCPTTGRFRPIIGSFR
jgi:hypothetical protein